MLSSSAAGSEAEHFHVAANMLLQRREWRHAESGGELLAEFFLLARQRVDGLFEIARNHHLHAVAVEPDQLTQERGRQQILAGLVFLFKDDLRQYRARNVIAGFGVVDEEVLALLHHRREVLKRHIGTGSGIIEPPVGVFLDRGGLVCFRHGLTHAHRGREPDGIAEGLTRNASQQSKHFQMTSATVLCGTVNSKA